MVKPLKSTVELLMQAWKKRIQPFLQRISVSQIEQNKLIVVIATIAFGMGVNAPDIVRVVHWGPSQNVLNFWQEVGRRARGGYVIHTCTCTYPLPSQAE